MRDSSETVGATTVGRRTATGQRPPRTARRASDDAIVTGVAASVKPADADETVAKIFDPGRGKTKTGQLWAYARNDRPWAGGTSGRGLRLCAGPQGRAANDTSRRLYRRTPSRGL